MGDREMLESAARAAGIKLVWPSTPGLSPRLAEVLDTWNPLTEDDDAFRLAVNLKLDIFTGQGPNGDITTVCAPQELDLESCGERHGTDAAAATRRAIVRVAAEIGKGI